MKVLWICNLILPEIAAQLGGDSIPKEGWVAGLLHAILRRDIAKISKTPEGLVPPELEIAIAFPAAKDLQGRSGRVNLEGFPDAEIEYYCFYENMGHPEVYDEALEGQLEEIFRKANPDLVHLFGTEFPHCLAAGRAWNKPERLLIGIQGPISEYAKLYMAHMPERVQNSATFRDLIKRDTIKIQQEKFYARGENEKKGAALAGHFAGRTDFDHRLAMEWNPKATYHHGGETLREAFYEGEWTREKAQPHRVFVSQADYPIKGFHYLLSAAKILREKQEVLPDGTLLKPFEDLEIYVAGQSIVEYTTMKDKLKISAYGKFLRELMMECRLETRVHILGRLSAEEMKKQYLLCDLFVCPSACENSPNSLGEAMILKVPCVAANVGGISTIFTDRQDGLLYDCRPDMTYEQVVQALADAMEEAWSDPEKMELYRLQAGEHGRSNHNPEKNVEELVDIYRSMAAK